MHYAGEPQAGNHYLIRFQDRLVWTMILERGAAYCSVSIKGLELQETSCHTTEAARLDDIFEMSFEKEAGFSVCTFNQYPLHSLTPVDACGVQTYSDARNVLTGVIDTPNSADVALKFFARSLVWLLLHHVNRVKKKEEEEKKKQQESVRTREIPTKKPSLAAGKVKTRGVKNGGSSVVEINHNLTTSNFNTRDTNSSSVHNFNINTKDTNTSSVSNFNTWDANASSINNNRLVTTNLPLPTLPPLVPKSALTALTPVSSDGRAKNVFTPPPFEDSRPSSAQSIEKVRKSSWSSSINSFSDSLWSDDDLDKPKVKKKSLKQAKVGHSKTALSQPASVTASSIVPKFYPRVQEKSDLDDMMEELDFGLPSVNVGYPKPSLVARTVLASNPLLSSSRINGNHIYKPVTNLAGSPDFKCQYSSQISLPTKWRELPIEHSQIVRHMSAFPIDWYKHVLAQLDWSATGLPREKVAADVGADEALTNCYSQLIMACCSAFDTPGKNVPESIDATTFSDAFYFK